VRNIRLDHSDQPVAVAQRVIPPSPDAGLEDIERHLPRGSRSAPGSGNTGIISKLAGSAIFGIDRHLRSQC
jgi:hypothetical protein